ncbi:MAG: CRISPR-associated endonuclease Cas1 [Nitrosopumilus sp.]|nr:CRISPR-associated endonuclease Cas1 [Nitrosopumilus sp.]
MRQQHFHVKFLKGYGFSISVKNSKLILKNCYDPFSKPTIEEWFVKDMPYQRIILQGKGYISTESLSLLSENNRTVVLLDNRGKQITLCHGLRDSLTATKYKIAQYDTFRDKSNRSYLTQQILKAKIQSQIRFLKSTSHQEILANICKLEKSGISEAVSSRDYFDNYTKLIDVRFGFKKRNSVRIEKKNATDVINALLNYGYAVLAGQISSYINGIGLDTYYGFMHKNHTSFQSLVYDMMEPFRWLVDYSVWKISDAKSSRISKKQYAYTRDGIVVLEYDLIRKFLELLERTFQKERQYDYRHGKKTRNGLKSVKEITVAKIMVQNLAEYCTGKQKEFRIQG